MTRVELAVARFKEGFRCSQAVLEAWSEEIGIDPMLARKMSTPLAGGSGLGGECGALTGAFLVIGWKYGTIVAGNAEGLIASVSRVHELASRFKAIHGALNCSDLLDLDVFSEEGLREFEEKDMKMTRCVRYVEDTMNILEQLMGKDDK
ncbi:MAG: C-GCAxxG-C-C family protein [Syntrophobacteraceae bacterium]